MIKTEEVTAQKPLPVGEAESWLQLAMLPHVAPWTDAHVSARSGLDAGGVAWAGLRRAQACICCEAGMEKFSRRVLVAMCSPASSFHVSVPIFSPCLRFHTLARVHTTASCHRDQNCELGVHRKAACPEEGCGASLHREVNAFDGTQQLVGFFLFVFFLKLVQVYVKAQLTTSSLMLRIWNLLKNTHIHTMTVYCMYWSQINGSLFAYYNGQLNLKYNISMNHL